jgi:RNA polymerase sigma-70 factor (ECF subfamily)
MPAFFVLASSPVNVQSPTSTESSSSIHSTLLRQVRQGDGEAWERLVATFSPLIYDWCRQQGVQAADAPDVMQDVFRVVFRDVGKFRRERPGDSFRGWLWTVTRNRIRDYFRARSRQADAYGGTDAWQRLQELPDREPESDTGSHTSNITSSPLHRALELVRNDFSATTWQAFWRVAVERHAAAEVAGELSISVNAVRKAKARVLRRVREEFGELLD